MKPLFRSPILQKRFESEGFVKVPLLSPEEASELLSSYKTVAAQHEKINIPYITTSHSNDPALIGQVDEMLQRIIGPAVSRFLLNYQLLFGNYLVKMPSSDSETSPHQDITFVDESQFASANIWVALQETNEENGCMFFSKGSHLWMPTLRPTHDYPWPYENVKQEIKQLSETYPAKPGEAFIFNHAVVHGSHPNNSAKPRVAAVIAAYHKEAQLIHYYLPEGENRLVKKYSMTKEAYLHFKKGEPPAKGVFLGEEVFSFELLSRRQFDGLIGKKTKEVSIFNSLVDFFKKQ